MSLFATKPIARIMRESEAGTHQLKRTLGPVNLVALGIGAIIGAGLFALTPKAAHDNAGPAVVFSFIIAAFGCAFAGMCYSEFATMIPIAGQRRTYAYATMGELLAWIIGWDLVLEYAVGAATVSVSWSKYLLRLLQTFGITFPAAFSKSPFEGGIVNLPAILIICAISIVLIIGIQESARFNRLHRGAESLHRRARHRPRLCLYQSQPTTFRSFRQAPESSDTLRLERSHAGGGRNLLRVYRL